MGTSPIRVLVVEGDPDLGLALQELLEAEQMQVRLVRDGAAGLRELGVFQPHVVILEMVLPVLDGVGFLRGMQQQTHKVPVLAISGFSSYLEAARSLGAHDAVSVVLDPDELVRKLRAMVGGAPPQPPPSQATMDGEARRLEAVLRLELETREPSAMLQAFTERVARIFDVPVCLVSIITAARQHWYARCGLPEPLEKDRGSARDESFCTHAVVSRSALVVQDALQNPLFADNRLVQEHSLRFYAGIPLFSRTGDALGTLCLLDFKPRAFSHFDLELLSVLARRVMGELEHREQQQNQADPPSAFRYLAHFDQELGVLGRENFEQALMVESLRHLERHEPLCVAAVVLAEDSLGPAVYGLSRAFPRGLFGRLAKDRFGLLLPGAEPQAAEQKIRGAAAGLRGLSAVPLSGLVGAPERILAEVEASAAAAATRA